MSSERIAPIQVHLALSQVTRVLVVLVTQQEAKYLVLVVSNIFRELGDDLLQLQELQSLEVAQLLLRRELAVSLGLLCHRRVAVSALYLLAEGKRLLLGVQVPCLDVFEHFGYPLLCWRYS